MIFLDVHFSYQVSRYELFPENCLLYPLLLTKGWARALVVRNKSKSWPPAMHTGKPELYICLDGGSQASLWGWARGLHLLNTHPLPSACSEGLALRLPPHVSSDYTKKKQSFLFLHSFHTYWLHYLLGPKNTLYLITYYLSFFFMYVCMYVCIYGCVGSSFLCEGFL